MQVDPLASHRSHASSRAGAGASLDRVALRLEDDPATGLEGSGNFTRRSLACLLDGIVTSVLRPHSCGRNSFLKPRHASVV
jgi:hypothetical protein